MQFRSTQNKSTGKWFYYVDSKRVSYEKYNSRQIECNIKGMAANSFLTRSTTKYWQHFSSFN
jgi:hypothetical protein